MNVFEIPDLFSLIVNQLHVCDMMHMLSTCTLLYDCHFSYHHYVCTSSNRSCFIKIQSNDIRHVPSQTRKLELELNESNAHINKRLNHLIKLNIECQHDNPMFDLFTLNMHQFCHLHTIKITHAKINGFKSNTCLIRLPESLQIFDCHIPLRVKIPLNIHKLKLFSEKGYGIVNTYDTFNQLHSFRDDHQSSYNYVHMMPNCQSLSISTFTEQFEIPLSVKKLTLFSVHNKLNLQNHVIEKLYLLGNFNNAHIQWPKTLIRLYIQVMHNPFIKFDFPLMIKHLTLVSYGSRNNTIPSFPSTLQRLTIKSESNQLIIPEYPTSLTRLKIHTRARHHFIIHELPLLNHLTFHQSDSKYTMCMMHMPSLKYLNVQRFSISHLNQKIKYLHCETFSTNHAMLPDCTYLIIDNLNLHLDILNRLLPDTLQSLIIHNYKELDDYSQLFDNRVNLKYVKINNQRIK